MNPNWMNSSWYIVSIPLGKAETLQKSYTMSIMTELFVSIPLGKAETFASDLKRFLSYQIENGFNSPW